MSLGTLGSSSSWKFLITKVMIITLHFSAVFSFVPNEMGTSSAVAFIAADTTTRKNSSLMIKPSRLKENVEGALYVNDRVSCRWCHCQKKQSVCVSEMSEWF